jgi:hypothetical protein
MSCAMKHKVQKQFMTANSRNWNDGSKQDAILQQNSLHLFLISKMTEATLYFYYT